MMLSLLRGVVMEAQGYEKALRMVMENCKALNMGFQLSDFYLIP